MADLTRGEFVDLLVEEFECKNDSELANKLGISIANWRKGKDKLVSKAIVRNVLKAGLRYRVHSAIEPIVEFYPFDFDHGTTFASRLNNRDVKGKLESSCGIYIFRLRRQAYVCW
jgi:hypothetical protein